MSDWVAGRRLRGDSSHWSLEIVTPPATEPISLTEARLHLREDCDADDDLVTALIVAARETAERMTRRSLITQTLALHLDRFEYSQGVISLPRSPVTSVTSIAYTDIDGNPQTVSAPQTDLTSEPARVKPAFDTDWPDTQDIIDAVTITYVAGYANAAAVPQTIKQAMLLLIGHWYEHREEVVIGTTPATVPMAAKVLLQGYQIPWFE